jgi:hypothetical protein
MADCLYYIDINGVSTPMTEAELKAYLEGGGLDELVKKGDIDLSKIKSKEYAVQKRSTEKILQPTQTGVGETGGERTGVERGKQGEKVTIQGEGDEKIKSPRERKKSILNTLLEANLSEETKMLIEDNGTYFQANMEQAEIAAKSIIKDIGVENAIIAAKTGEVHPSVGSAIFAESINDLFTREQQLRAEGETNKADDLALRQADLISEYSDISTSSGQWIAQIKRFYKTSPLGIVRKINTERKRMLEAKFAQDRLNFKSLYDQIIKGEEVQGYIRQKAEEIIKEEKQQERKTKRESIFKKIDETAKLWIEKLTPKGAKGAEKLGVGVEEIINTAADAMKKAYIAGESINVIIDEAVRYISDKLGTSDWDIEAFRKDWTEKLTTEADKKEQKYIDALDRRRKELERRIKENDFSAEKYREKITMSEKAAEAKKELDDVKKLYDEAKKKSPEYIDKKAKQYLDNFRQKLKTINEDQKEEIIKRSIKKLIQNGALEYEDFKTIIGESIGLGELSPEDVKNIESLMTKINATNDLLDKMVSKIGGDQKELEKATEEYDKAVDEASVASTEMYNIITKDADITSTLRSLITGSLLSIPTLIKNPIYNIIFQAQLRFPKAVVKNLFEQGLFGASKMINQYISSKIPIYMPKSNILKANLGYFKGGKLGAKRGWRNFLLGVTQPDFNSTSAYQSSLSPRQAAKDLQLYKAGQKVLTKTERLDRYIRKSWPARQADFILRAMGLGDLPQRYAAEGAVAMEIAVKELGLMEDADIVAFMRSPQKVAYKILSERKDPNAASLSEEMAKRIISEGEKAVFQEGNMLSKASEFVDNALKVNKDSEYKATKYAASVLKTANFPFIKIPANVSWAMFKAANPAFALAQSGVQASKSFINAKNGNMARAKEFEEKAKDSFAHAVVGYGLAYVAADLVARGFVRPSNDRDTKEKESVGEAVFGRQNQLNWGALQGGEDYWIDLTWFGPLGAILETKAEMAQDKKQRELKGEEQSAAMDLIDEMTYSAKAAMNQLVFDQGARIMDAIQKGGVASRQYFINNVINNITNIATGGTMVALSKFTLPYKAQLAGETAWEEIVNNTMQRQILARVAANLYQEGAGNPPSKISIFDGEPIKNDNSVLGVVGSMMGMEKGSNDKFGAIIFNDFERTGNLDFFPPAIPKEITVNEEKIKLTPKEKRELTIAIGKANYNNISPFINDMAILEGYNKKYSQLTDSQKINALKFLYETAREEGLDQFKLDNPKYNEAKFDMAKEKKEFEESKPQIQFEISVIKDKYKTQKQP